ncbi:MAG: PLP-dependent aminotransferase family protein [Gemmatimonadota bacterium]
MLALDPAGPEPLQRQLYAALRSAILEGRLAPGVQLPATRALAESLEVSRTTVSLVFDQLRAEGYLEGRARSGTFVADVVPDTQLGVSRDRGTTERESRRAFARSSERSSRGAMRSAVGDAAVAPPGEGPAGVTRREPGTGISRRGSLLASLVVTSTPLRGGSGARAFRLGTPALDDFPHQLWGRLLGRSWRRVTASQLSYAEPHGALQLRTAIAAYVAQARAVRCEPEQVIVVSGAQQAFDLVGRVLLDVGDAAAVEDPGYRGTRAALLAAGARLVPVTVDDDGMDVAALRALSPSPRMACVTPSHQFPLGVTLSAARRLSLLDWARANDAWIVEDDFDSEYRFRGRPLPSLQGMTADARVVYVGTFSKTLFPALRLGYLIAPPALVEPFARARAAVDRHPPALEQAVLAEFIAEGHFARHVRRMRALYAERQATLLQLLAGEPSEWLHAEPVDAGMHLVAWLHAGLDDARIARRLLDAGVIASPLRALSVAASPRGALLLGFAAFDRATMTRGLDTLCGVLRHEAALA